MKRTIASVILCVVASGVLACGENPVEGPKGNPALAFAADSVALDVGKFASVSVTLSNTSDKAQYISRDGSIATVNANGSIGGVSVGTTYIVAALSGNADVRDSVRVRVNPDTCAIARPDFGVASAEERALFSYDVNAPLNLVKGVEIANSVYQQSNISYTSPAGGSVPGILVEPVGRSGQRPAIVLLHPSGLNAKNMAGYAQFLTAKGAVVIAIDAPYWRRTGPSLLLTSQDRVEQIQLMKDLQRAVDVLRSMPNVDPARIGFEGYSYGGILGAQFVGIEKRLKAAVLAAAMGGQVTGMTTPAGFAVLNNMPCAARNTWFRDMTPIEPIRFIGNAPPTTLLFQAGRTDNAVLLADAQALYNAAAEPKEFRIYEAGHSLNQQALDERQAWWSEKLGLDPNQ